MAKAAEPSSVSSAFSSLSAGISGFAGAGIGTLVLSLAKNLPDANIFKSWLVIASPTIAVVIA